MDTLVTVPAALEVRPGARVFSWDVETFIGRRSEFAPRIVCGAWSWDGAAADLGLRDAALRALMEAVSDPTTLILNMFVAYDLMCALEEFERPEYPRLQGLYGTVPVPSRMIWEKLRAGGVVGIDICQQLLDVARGEGLIEWREKQGYNLPNIKRWNELPAEDKDDHAWRTYYSQLEGIEIANMPEDAREYMRGDATDPHKVLAKQLQENQRWIESYGHPVLHQAPEQTWTQVCLHLVAGHAVRVSPPRATALAEQVQEEIDRLARQLRHKGRYETNEAGKVRWVDECHRGDQRPGESDGCPGCLAPEPLLRWKKEKGEWYLSRNTKVAAARMVSIMAAKGKATTRTEPSKRFPEGQVQLDEDACVLSGDRVLQAYADYTGASVLQSRVDDLLQGVSGWPLHTSFTSVRATGRTSSRKPRPPHYGTQQQNWPRIEGAREALEPRVIRVPV